MAATATTTRVFTDAERAILDRVREAVLSVEPNATVVLYGSRARGDHAPNSDWDLLILLDGEVNDERERAVSATIRTIGRYPDLSLSPVVRSNDAWEMRLFRANPFHQNVERDGITLEPGWPSFGARRRAARWAFGEGDVGLSAERDELMRLELERAHETLVEADAMASIGAWNTCVNCLDYACFYAASAPLLRDGRTAARHSGVQSTFNRYYVHGGVIESDLGDLYNRLFERRNTADYNLRVRLDEADVRPLIPEARRFVERVASLLQSPDERPS